MTSPEGVRKLYAIMRVAKIKSLSALTNVAKHNTRERMSENVRVDGPPPVELLEDGAGNLVAGFHTKLAELQIDKKSTAGKVLAVEAMVTASRGWFEMATPDMIQAWIDANVKWAREKFGKGLFSGKLHLDEEVIHIHFVAIPAVQKQAVPRGAPPKDPEKRAEYHRKKASAESRWTLSYHDVLGGKRERLGEEQTSYHLAMAHLGLERGEIQRVDIEIELGDELMIAAAELSKGHDQDGQARPRRNIPPQEYRRIIKKLRNEAEEKLKDAEILLLAAERERAEAKSVRLDAERSKAEAIEIREELEKQREELTVKAAANVEAHELLLADRAAFDDERRANVTKFEAQRAELDHRERQASDRENLQAQRGADLKMQESQLKELEMDASAARDKARNAQNAADTARSDMENALESARRSRDTAAEALEKAAEKLKEAEAQLEHARVARDRAESDRRQLETERALHQAQLALLDRATDEDSGLNLRRFETGITMNTLAMSPEEKSTFKAPWPEWVLKIGQWLAKAAEDMRILTAQLINREKDVALREAAVEAKKAAAELDFARREEELINMRDEMRDDVEQRGKTQRQEHEAALAKIRAREIVVRESERYAADLVSKAESEVDAAKQVSAKAELTKLRTLSWIQIIENLETSPKWIDFDYDQKISYDRTVAARLPKNAQEALQQEAPDWAKLIVVRRNMALDAYNAAQSASDSAQSEWHEVHVIKKGLTEMANKAGPVLTAAQQSMKDDVETAVHKANAAQIAAFRNGLGR